MKFEIDISDDGFSATKDGEVIAQSRSGMDLLCIFNDIWAAAGSDGTFVGLVNKCLHKQVSKRLSDRDPLQDALPHWTCDVCQQSFMPVEGFLTGEPR